MEKNWGDTPSATLRNCNLYLTLAGVAFSILVALLAYLATLLYVTIIVLSQWFLLSTNYNKPGNAGAVDTFLYVLPRSAIIKPDQRTSIQCTSTGSPG